MPSKIIADLIAALGNDNVLTKELVSERYDHIWNMNMPLQAKAVLLPRTSEDVSAIMKICNRFRQPVVVHGGLTNLVGSTKTTSDDIVIAMEKMNAIEETDSLSRSMTVQAGVILENIQQEAESHGMLFPLNFGAKGSAQIGGIISTNAGGLRVIKYGMTRNLVLGIEAVLCDGRIVNSMKKIIKDNSAYDLKQIFIGSEGTLGIVTRAILRLVEAPRSRTSAFVGFNDYEKVVAFLKYLDKNLAGALSGYELIWQKTYQTMTRPPSILSPPLPHDYNYYVLTEFLGTDPASDRNRFMTIMEKATENQMFEDAVIAQNESDLEWFWKIREDVHVFVSQCTYDQHFDISLPIPLIGRYIKKMVYEIYQLDDIEHVFPFGHIADGNIHLVVGKKNNSDGLREAINQIVYQPLKEIGGSISAEHGIGLDKKDYLELCRTKEEINLMRQLKQSLDPNQLLNRGKVLNFE